MTLRILHFSDPHAGGTAEDWLAYIDKRGVGCFNFRYRRSDIHHREYLRQFCAYAAETKPDLVVCTGDLTSTGQCGEFQASLADMKVLIDSGIPMIYVPGNHDYYTHRKKCVAEMKRVFQKLNAAFNLTFDSLPCAVEFKGVTFLLVGEAEPTPLVSSCGYLKKKDADFLLAKLSGNDKPALLIGHYPLIEDHPLLRFRHRLWGQKSIVPLLKNGTLCLSLNGHIHAPYLRKNQNRVLECCAGSITRFASFAEILIEPDSPQTVQVRVLRFTNETVAPFEPLTIRKESL